MIVVKKLGSPRSINNKLFHIILCILCKFFLNQCKNYWAFKLFIQNQIYVYAKHVLGANISNSKPTIAGFSVKKINWF